MQKRMTILKDFIDWYILPNSLIRLHYPESRGYEQIVLKMEWELKKSQYRYNNVIGVADILCVDGYSEAINIVIEKMSVTDQRKIKLENIELNED